MMTWNEFWQSHNKQNYTPTFNSFLDSQIADERLPLLMRVLAWVLRNSWGRWSDSVIDANGIRQGQTDCARELGVLLKNGKPNRPRMSEAFAELKKLNLVSFEGFEIQPVENPLGVFAQSSNSVHPHTNTFCMTANIMTADRLLEEVWKVEKPIEYAEYQMVERRYKELRTALMSDLKKRSQMFGRGRTFEGNGSEGDEHEIRQGENTAFGRVPTSPSASLNRTEELLLNGSASSSFPLIRDAIRQYAPEPDDDALTQMLKACRRECEDCSEPEIVHFIHVKAKLLKPHISNVVGFLLKAVPRCFEADSIREHRERNKAGNGVARIEPTIIEQIEALEGLLRELPSHVNAAEWREQLEALHERKPVESEQGQKAQKAGGTK